MSYPVTGPFYSGLMATPTTQNLSKLGKHFSDEDSARELLQQLRWGTDGAVCPHCGGADPYKLTAKPTSKKPVRKGVWKCRQCRKQFTVTVGTIFESSHVPISKWLMAIHLLSASKKGISAHQLHRLLGITYRAAWFVAHRLRHAMTQDVMQLEGIVEADETYIGPRRRRVGDRNNWTPKTPVMAFVERGGRAVAFPIEKVDHKTLHAAVKKHVNPTSTLMTDEGIGYFAMPVAKHDTITHGRQEYVRGMVSTNTVEGFFGLF